MFAEMDFGCSNNYSLKLYLSLLPMHIRIDTVIFITCQLVTDNDDDNRERESHSCTQIPSVCWIASTSFVIDGN